MSENIDRLEGLSAERKQLLEILLRQSESADESRKTAKAAIIPRLSRDVLPVSFPASFAQRWLWFLNQLAPDTVSYNIRLVFQVDGALNIDSLGHSVSEIVRRHEALRTTFVEINGEPFQLVSPPESQRTSNVD